jgi:hypothetical protein
VSAAVHDQPESYHPTGLPQRPRGVRGVSRQAPRNPRGPRLPVHTRAEGDTSSDGQGAPGTGILGPGTSGLLSRGEALRSKNRPMMPSAAQKSSAGWVSSPSFESRVSAWPKVQPTTYAPSSPPRVGNAAFLPPPSPLGVGLGPVTHRHRPLLSAGSSRLRTAGGTPISRTDHILRKSDR